MIAVRYCSVFSLLSLLTPRPGKTPDTHYFSLLREITHSLVGVRGRFALLRLSKGVRYTVYTKWPMYYNSHTSNKDGLKNVPFFFSECPHDFPCNYRYVQDLVMVFIPQKGA